MKSRVISIVCTYAAAGFLTQAYIWGEPSDWPEPFDRGDRVVASGLAGIFWPFFWSGKTAHAIVQAIRSNNLCNIKLTGSPQSHTLTLPLVPGSALSYFTYSSPLNGFFRADTGKGSVREYTCQNGICVENPK